VPVLGAGLVVAFGPAGRAAAAPGAFGGMDHPTQVTGTAVLYGTSAPPAASTALAPHAASSKDSGVAPLFSRNPRMNNAARAMQRATASGMSVVGNAGGATGFNGLDHADQRNAGTGIYVNTQFSLEPPDQGLCVGNGFVVEPVNTAFAVYNEGGTKLTATTALNQFYKLSPAVVRSTPPVRGDFLSDPKCYWDPVGHRFIQTILEMDAPGPANTFPFFQRGHVLIAVSQTADPTGTWNLYSMDTSDDGLNGTPAHTQCPCLGDQPLLGANRDGVFIDTNEFQNNAQGFFNGAQLYALGRAALESGASSLVFDHLDIGTVPTGDANLPFWGPCSRPCPSLPRAAAPRC